MFTGIVTDVGRVRAIDRQGDWRFEIETAFDPDTIDIGASIICSGACLTVIARGMAGNQPWFAVEVSEETRRATTLGEWAQGTPINLERSLKVGDELGGHIVLGHVDGVGEVVSITPENESLCYRFKAPKALMGQIASKGSIAVDGVSLTVNSVGPDWFEVNVIPHTRKVTTFGRLEAGAHVNLEVDVLSRYIAQAQKVSQGAA
jgi:riboflavin synthase